MLAARAGLTVVRAGEMGGWAWTWQVSGGLDWLGGCRRLVQPRRMVKRSMAGGRAGGAAALQIIGSKSLTALAGELERKCYDTGRGQEFDVISAEIHAYQIGHGGSGRNARVIGRIRFMSGYVRPFHLAKDEIIPSTRMPIIRETRAAHIAKAPVVER